MAAGHSVVAAGRNPAEVEAAIGANDRLFTVKLDVTNLEEAKASVSDAVTHFGKIDVLVNNAGNFFAGFFEELSPEQVKAQIETNLFGPMNVTRAVVPVMRKQRSGLIVCISSRAGLSGIEFCTAYSASKFGIEGWIEAMTPEVAPFGIRTMLVEPGSFRTELLQPNSTTYVASSIADYATRTTSTVEAWKRVNGKQPGDPAKLARALVELTDTDNPPLRWMAGSDMVAAAEKKIEELQSQIDAHRTLSTSLGYDDHSGWAQGLRTTFRGTA